MIRIKRADTTDDEVVDELKALHGLCFGSSAPPLGWTDCYGAWWQAKLPTDENVGFAAIVPAADLPGTGYLKRVGVLPGWRGMGLQRRFIRVRESYARRQGWDRIVTDTTDNPASANNLIRCGYRIFEPQCKWAFGDRSIYWEKTL